MGLEVNFLASGINAEAHVLDANEENGVYGSGPNVMLFNTKGQRRVTALPCSDACGHIHAVQLIKDHDQNHIFSCGTDKKIRHWVSSNADWVEKESISHDTDLLLLRCTLDLKFAAAADREGNILIYKLDNHQLIQKIPFGPKRVHSLAWADNYLLAIGVSDRSIRLVASVDEEWKQVISLQGHTNWATCLDWTPRLEGNVRFLASSGPDKSIRVWKLAPKQDNSLVKSKLQELVPKKNTFSLGNEEWILENESILYGHEGTVNSCRWSSAIKAGDSATSVKLISSSTDHTLIVWAPGNQMWSSKIHLGDISGSGSLGVDRSFGFYSGILLDNESLILSHGSKGSVQFWELIDGAWITQEPLTGHYGPIQSCSWDVAGRYLLTTSLDQTSRAWAPFKGTWYEIARPQIHGYDLQCIATVDGETFLSGADEKIIRAFKAPETFLKRLNCLQSGGDHSEEALEKPVFVPALGLSNKDASDFDSSYGGPSVEQSQTAEMPLGRPPSESDLCKQTLWPELDKLYGHGYELYSLAVSPCSRLAASASKANLSADGAIRFWAKQPSGDRWLAVPNGVISGHSLTIVSLAFSPDGKHLLATSRDRSWSVTSISPGEDGSLTFKMVQREESGHSRIIWDGAWTSNESFLTASRDSKIKSWSFDGTSYVCQDVKTVDSGVTAIAYDFDNKIVVVGQETGALSLFQLPGWTPIASASSQTGSGPSAAINDLSFRPGTRMIACISADRSLRLYNY